MANSLKANQTNPIAGLGTFTHTVVNAATFTVDCQTTLPAGSNVQIVLKQNSTTLITIGGVASNPTPTQPSIGARTPMTCASGDVISVILSSTANIDTQPNQVKSIINIYTGF